MSKTSPLGSTSEAMPAFDPKEIDLEKLTPEELELFKLIQALAEEAIEDPATSGNGIEKPVTQEQGSEAIQNIAIQAGIIQEKNPSDTMAEIELRCQQELATAKLNQDAPQVNYLVQMSRLIASISTLLNQWNQRDSARTEGKKKEYNEASTTIQDNHYTKGGWNLALGVVNAALSFYNPNASLGPLQTAINNFLDGQGTKPSQKVQLLLQEMQKGSEASQTNNDLREKALNVLQTMEQWAITAARHG